MTTMVSELYDALRKAGVEDELARAAAKAVIAAEDKEALATKADLQELKLATKADLADLKAELIKWNVGTLLALAAIVSAIVKLT